MTTSNDSTNEKEPIQFVLQINPKDTYKLNVSNKIQTLSFKMQEVKE
jgi:hypothetical protein